MLFGLNDINRNKNDKKEKNNITNFIHDNSQFITNNNLYNFIKSENFGKIDNNFEKNEIFAFSTFVNSCKMYSNISELKKDIKKVLKNKELINCDYYYNIIYNYFENILGVISADKFFENKKNVDNLNKIIKKINKYFWTKNNDFEGMKDKILQIQKNILKILEKNNKGIEGITIGIDTMKKNIELINNSADNIDKISNIYKNNQEQKKNKNKFEINQLKKSSKNKTQFTNNESEKKESNYKFENEEKMYNYENIMYPPIKNDDTD